MAQYSILPSQNHKGWDKFKGLAGIACQTLQGHMGKIVYFGFWSISWQNMSRNQSHLYFENMLS